MRIVLRRTRFIIPAVIIIHDPPAAQCMTQARPRLRAPQATF